MVSWLCHCQKQSPKDVLIKKVFLIIWENSQEHTCVRVSFLIKLQASACNFIKKETLAHVFSCEFFKVCKNSFFYRTPTLLLYLTSLKGRSGNTFWRTDQYEKKKMMDIEYLLFRHCYFSQKMKRFLFLFLYVLIQEVIISVRVFFLPQHIAWKYFKCKKSNKKTDDNLPSSLWQ